MIAAIVYILLMVVVFIMAEKRKRNAFVLGIMNDRT